MVFHQLVFVDDESIVREGVESRIPWNSLGFNLAGIFENGLDALKFIETNSVDVVISDINMPKMDGLELSRILSEKYPSIAVVLLTGYDEFEYARSAVKNKVREFLLKPITADELSSVLKNIHSELNTLKEKEKQHELILRKLELSFPLLKERFLFQLVTGKISEENIGRRKDFFQWTDLGKFYQVVIINLPGDCEEVGVFTLMDYVGSLKNDHDEIFSDREGNIVVLLQGDDKNSIRSGSRHISEKTFLFAETIPIAQIYIGIGDVVEKVEDIHKSYREAYSSSDYARILGFSQIVFIHDIRKKEKLSTSRFRILEESFSRQLKEGSRELALEAFGEIVKFMKEHYVSKEEISYYFTRIHTLLQYFVKEMDLFPTEEDFMPPVPVFNSIVMAEKYFIDKINRIEDRIQDYRNNMVLSRIEKAKRVISLRYSDKSFSLSDICNELFISTSQFSVIFKEGTGQTFVEYLTAFRINEAKKLLKKTDMKSYEVAEAVGFSDSGYFSIIFKKLTGITPMEFRRSLGR